MQIGTTIGSDGSFLPLPQAPFLKGNSPEFTLSGETTELGPTGRTPKSVARQVAGAENKRTPWADLHRAAGASRRRC